MLVQLNLSEGQGKIIAQREPPFNFEQLEGFTPDFKLKLEREVPDQSTLEGDLLKLVTATFKGKRDLATRNCQLINMQRQFSRQDQRPMNGG